MKIRIITSIIIILWTVSSSIAQKPRGYWPADYSDLDCIKVGDDYYAISSTMQYSPGMTILMGIETHCQIETRHDNPRLYLYARNT